MRVYVATTNAGKLREMERIFADSDFQLATYAGYEGPVEGDTSYPDNAALKARALHAQLEHAGNAACVLADDSGIEVYALDRRPGVLTADYGGPGASWPDRRKKLLEEVAASGRADRRARFVCAMHFIDADGREFASMGTVDGLIPERESGAAGFSFDPVFWYPPAQKTFAELSEDEKNRVSHRAIAAAGLIAAFQASTR
ncbi:MAG: RdgB/HAM1 family non-canonical purine NTP pyrophosphatase [Candidatus Velthaea sp.]